jgi:homogentisate 1,2-dioxygenase
MPFYHKLGIIPPKRHTIFRNKKGNLYHEQLFGTIGFDGMYTNSYHLYRPTQVQSVATAIDVNPKIAVSNNLKSYALNAFKVKSEKDYLDSRKIVLTNNDCHISVAAPSSSLRSYFYKNADADELLFIHKGAGTLRTMLGNIKFGYGDYLMIPRGVIYQIDFEDSDNRLFIVESKNPIYTPKRYRNWFGQLLEHAPYCERDIRKPVHLETIDEKGSFTVKIKKGNQLTALTYATHPFDVVGYDGYNYPYALSIHDFEPITGRIHQPPPVHQTFESKGFVVCSFVPRLYDYHPKAIPAPYNHSNIDSDEVLYYVDGNFMSRNHVEPGIISLHPSGIPHGPHPGAAERSIGKTKTDELAVMVDTFSSLMLTEEAVRIAEENYYQSWLDQ